MAVDHKLCECGCGKPVTPGRRFCHNHHRRGVKVSKKTIKKRVESLKRYYSTHTFWKKGKVLVDGQWADKDKIELPLCACGCGKWAKPGRKFVNGHNMRGRKRNPMAIEKTRAKVLGQKRPDGNWNPWSRGLSKQTDDRVKEMSEKISKSMKEKFRDPDFCKRWGQSHRVMPNKLEQEVETILDKLFPGEYKYVGDFDTFIGGKCPDFINVNGQKKIIEVFGNYWHKEGDEQERINHFTKYGFKTLVIWEEEFVSNKDLVVNKIMDFHND